MTNVLNAIHVDTIQNLTNWYCNCTRVSVRQGCCTEAMTKMTEKMQEQLVITATS